MSRDRPDARSLTLRLLAARPPGATVCPSEVARSALGADDPPDAWRQLMPAVHAAVDQLIAERRVALSWKGRDVAARAGPYRIRKTDLG